MSDTTEQRLLVAEEAIDIRNKWIKWLSRTLVALGSIAAVVAACVVLLFALLLGTIRPLQSSVNQLLDGENPASEERRRYQAETRFILCSRNPNFLISDRADDIRGLCEGYETLSESYRSQNVEP